MTNEIHFSACFASCSFLPLNSKRLKGSKADNWLRSSLTARWDPLPVFFFVLFFSWQIKQMNDLDLMHVLQELQQQCNSKYVQLTNTIQSDLKMKDCTGHLSNTKNPGRTHRGQLKCTMAKFFCLLSRTGRTDQNLAENIKKSLHSFGGKKVVFFDGWNEDEIVPEWWEENSMLKERNSSWSQTFWQTWWQQRRDTCMNGCQ